MTVNWSNVAKPYVAVIDLSEPVGASAVGPESPYWRDLWLCEDPKRTQAQWEAKRKAESDVVPGKKRHQR